MFDLNFNVQSAEPLPFAAVPHLVFKLRISQSEARPETLVRIENVLLKCQIRIEPAKRRYDGASQEKLRDLFGASERWGQSLQTMLWTHADVIVPAFLDSTIIDLPVACTFDFNVAATKYFAALDDGEIPLCLLFSGSVFYRTEANALQVAQIPWNKEAYFRLPVSVWREMMEHYYPNHAWLALRRDVFDKVNELKSRQGLPSWEQALEHLLAAANEELPT